MRVVRHIVPSPSPPPLARPSTAWAVLMPWRGTSCNPLPPPWPFNRMWPSQPWPFYPMQLRSPNIPFYFCSTLCEGVALLCKGATKVLKGKGLNSSNFVKGVAAFVQVSLFDDETNSLQLQLYQLHKVFYNGFKKRKEVYLGWALNKFINGENYFILATSFIWV
eukprot:Gb_23272 [translate_table: standard]